MDAAIPSKHQYEPPIVSDYGTLAELTADTGMLLGVGPGSGLSVPLIPPPDTPDGPGAVGSGGGEALGSFQVPETGSEGGAVGEAAPGESGESAPAGAEAEGGGGGGGGGGELASPVEAGSGGGSLPFTGFAAAGMAALGGGIAGAGAALRRAVRRRRHRD